MDDRPRQNPAYRFTDSSPPSAARSTCLGGELAGLAEVAQLVELPPEERGVAGPSPAFGTRGGGDYWFVPAVCKAVALTGLIGSIPMRPTKIRKGHQYINGLDKERRFKMSNAEKTKLLGMPHGTASNKLRKMLLFRFAGALGWLGCYRCDQGTIKSIDDFSIEHKEPWMSAEDPVKAFFDLDNIAFSHLSCNAGVANRDKTHCPKGHGYTDDNTYVLPNGGRECRVCKRDRIERFHIAHPGWQKRSNRRARKQQREHGEMTER